jgi:hypothetical protein
MEVRNLPEHHPPLFVDPFTPPIPAMTDHSEAGLAATGDDRSST